MQRGKTISVRYVRKLLGTAAAAGLNADQLCREVDLQLDTPAAPDQRLAAEKYLDLWGAVMRRAGALRSSFASSLFVLFWFKGCIEIENIHPIEGGLLRRKVRRNRRPTLPVEPVWSFYPRYAAETVSKFVRWGWMYARLRMLYLPIKRDAKRREYTDLALTL